MCISDSVCRAACTDHCGCMTTEVIAFRSHATCYSHYAKSIHRETVCGKVVLSLRLDCKYNDPEHRPHLRERAKLKQGTSNFRASALVCDRRHGKGPSEQLTVPQYTEARHRAIIAVHVAARKRSFHSVEDPEYYEELKLVSQNPNIKIPSQETVRDDVERLFEGFAPLLTAYFEVSTMC